MNQGSENTWSIGTILVFFYYFMKGEIDVAQEVMDRRLLNLDLLILTKDNIQNMKEVKSLAIFEANSSVYKMDGLFSTAIFGPVGSKLRMQMPGYIDLKIPILHPLVYRTLISLNRLYEGIVTSKVKARYDSTAKDFILDNEHGSTGYTFFINNLDKVELSNNSDSDKRKFAIELVNKYKDKFMTKWIVIPAGLRDYTVNEAGQPMEDEVNSLYRKLLATASLLANTRIDPNDASLDTIKITLQKHTLAIYEHFESLLSDKGGFVQRNWASRSIAYGTRNVITSTPSTVTDLDKKGHLSFNDTVVGVVQYIKAISPIAMHKVHAMFINHVISPDIDTANLIDPKSLDTKVVSVPVKIREAWLSEDGLNKIFNKMGQDEIKREYVSIDGYYPCMVWDRGKDIYIIFDTNNLPEGCSKKDLRPITYIEMMYISIIECIDKYPALVTRYPVIEQGSIYPSKVYVKTTLKGRDVTVHIHGYELHALEYPLLNEDFVKSVQVNYSHLLSLSADYDGSIA